jgi:hypothetical protein
MEKKLQGEHIRNLLFLRRQVKGLIIHSREIRRSVGKDDYPFLY